MKKIICLFWLLPAILLSQGVGSDIEREEQVSAFLNSIRSNEAQLRKFFQSMPKGGDLHHHYSGSVYTETYLNYVEDNDLWINRNTYEVLANNPPRMEREHWSRVSSLKRDGIYAGVRLEMLKRWSVLYYNGTDLPSDEHFFATFGSFNIPKNHTYKVGLSELKERAKKENVQYIETMFTTLAFESAITLPGDYDQTLAELQEEQSSSIQDTLRAMYRHYSANPSFQKSVARHTAFVENLHTDLKIDDNEFTMRYQNYIVRVTNPTHVFKHLLACFASADQSDIIVGVNIVAPENNPVSMRDYWLHMQMFKFCSSIFPNVDYAMHAGELTLGLVKPEDLTWHINGAVKVAGAKRIGHGIDIMYEENSDELLRYMREKEIAIEINLVSNEFILGGKRICSSSHDI